MWSIALLIGSVLAGGVALGLWEKRNESRQFLIGLIPGLFVFAIGVVFVGAAFGGMHEKHGWPGVAAITAALAVLFAVVLVRFNTVASTAADLAGSGCPPLQNSNPHHEFSFGFSSNYLV